MGGANTIAKVDGNRIGADFNKFLIALYNAVKNGWKPPMHIEKDEHKRILQNKEKEDDALIGWCLTACTYSGSGCGYAGLYPKSRARKDGTIPSYQTESWNSLRKDIESLLDVEFVHSTYKDLEIPSESIIYCDPPYENTAQYKNVDNFNHKEFWQWCRDMTKAGHKVFVSEYNAPNDFKCVWKKELLSQLGITKKGAKSKNSTEKLFVYAN